MPLINILPITKNVNPRLLVNKIELDVPQLSPSGTGIFGSQIISYVVQSFAYGFLPQLLVTFEVREEIFSTISSKETLSEIFKQKQPMILELDPNSYISVTKCPKELGFDTSSTKIHHMFHLTSFLFPNTSLLYRVGTSVSVYYAVKFKEEKAIMRFSNIILSGKLPIYILPTNFISATYPAMMNNLLFVGQELLDVWETLSSFFSSQNGESTPENHL